MRDDQVKPGPVEPAQGERPKGLTTFLLLWASQALSLFGSGLARFGLGVWVFMETGSVLQFGLIALFGVLPGTLLSPLAGVWVDRWDRKKTLLFSDGLAALAGGAILWLVATGQLEVWHIYASAFVNSCAGAFQIPAFAAVTPLLVPKKHLARAAGLVQAGTGAAQVLAPLVAGVLLPRIELRGIMIAELVTFGVAAFLLLIVSIPKPRRSEESAAAAGSMGSEIRAAWRYLVERPGLLTLLWVFAGFYFATGMVQVLLTPLVLSFAPATVLGRVLAVGSSGMFFGGLLMAFWGGPKRRVDGILAALMVAGAVLIFGGLRPSAILISAAAFVFLFSVPIAAGCNRAIWQSKIEPDMLGRVMALSRVVVTGAMPLAYVTVGPLADWLFEPAMVEGGALAGTVGQWIGVGPGRGVAFLLMCIGAGLLVVLAMAWRLPRLRNVDSEIPDVIADDPELAIDDASPAAAG